MKLRQTSWILVAGLLLSGTVAFAQDQKQDQTAPIDLNAPMQPLDTPATVPGGNRPPVGAARGVSEPFDPQTYDPAQVAPDTNTLAGLAPITLGSLQHSRNIFDPSISFSQIGQTYPLTSQSSGPSIVTDQSFVSGSLNFDRTWSEYHLSTIYNGGEIFNYGFHGSSPSFGSIPPHYQFHNLAFTQEINWARWHVILKDNFSYSPGAAFTGQGIGGPGLAAQFSSSLGTSLNGISQSFQPSETINTGEADRYMNSVLGQAEYSFSRRSALTIAASYGLLHFITPGYFSSSLIEAQAGYDYELSPANSIAILGSYGRVSYTGLSDTTTEYVGAFAYGRKITGRLAFQIAAGPEEIQSVGAPGLGNFNLLFESVNSSLTYARRRGSVSINFVRGLTGGSGVFRGATSNTLSASARYQFTRYWTGSVNAGYAINNSLAPAGVSSLQFDNWFVGANLGRQIGYHAQVNLNYGATEQNPPANCPVVSCGFAGLQQTVGVSVNWHLRALGRQ
jgi:hypothetical protein